MNSYSLPEGGQGEVLERIKLRIAEPYEPEDDLASVPLIEPMRRAEATPQPREPGSPPQPLGADHSQQIIYDRTDIGNAQKFADSHKDTIRYDHLKKRWLIWTNHYWEPDYGPLLNQKVMAFVQDEYIKAATEEASIQDSKQRRATIHWSNANSERGVRIIERLAQDLPVLSDTGERWDEIPHLLGVPNGVVDLEAGTLRNGRPEDRITMQTRVPYDAEAECPRWDAFLKEIHPDDQDGEAIREYQHRAYGYSATGESRDHIINYLIGRGRNGKSVERNPINHILGDYGHVLPFTSLEYVKGARPTNDLADLFRKRMAISSEANKNVRLDTARIKTLTGEDEIRPRFLYKEGFTFLNRATIWVAVNDKPTVADDSDGFWERVKVIPYPNSYPEGGPNTDNTLMDRFKNEEAMGILAWIVRGAVEYYASGLGPIPASIAEQTQTYREENDPVAEFIDTKCERGDKERVIGTAFYNAYAAWARDQGFTDREIRPRREIINYLNAHFRKDRWATGRGVTGIRLLSEPAAPDDLGLEAEQPEEEDDAEINEIIANVWNRRHP